MGASSNKHEVGYHLFEDTYKATAEKKNLTAVWFEKKSYTFEELEKSVHYYARFLADHGVKPGDHVALLGANSYNWLVAFYAIIRLGGVAVLLNYMARHETLVDLIKGTDCKFLCYGRYMALIKNEGEFAALLQETGIDVDHSFCIQHATLDFKSILQTVTIEPFASPFSREEESKRTS